MRAASWQSWLRHRKLRGDSPNQIVSTVVGVMFVVLFVTVIVVLVWDRLHR
jgi:hypothetical protein